MYLRGEAELSGSFVLELNQLREDIEVDREDVVRESPVESSLNVML